MMDGVKKMWFAKICPICKERVNPSDLRTVEIVDGTKITCCKNCVRYLKIRQKEK
jgi:glutaredoxin-related protein